MSKKWKRILIIAVGIIALLIIYSVVSNKDKDLVKVTAEKAAIRSITQTVTASGQIYPEYEVKISPDVSGEITDLNVQEGDSVQKGQILARVYADNYALDRDEASARLGQSQANVANSEAALPKAFENMEKLGVPRGIVGFVLPAGYSFNLDGSTLHLAVASVFVASVFAVSVFAVSVFVASAFAVPVFTASTFVASVFAVPVFAVSTVVGGVIGVVVAFTSTGCVAGAETCVEPSWPLRELAIRKPPVPAADGALWDGRFRLEGEPPAGATLGALGADAARFRSRAGLPTAVLQTLGCVRSGKVLVAVPHLRYADRSLSARLRLCFLPPRPLAGAPFRPPEMG